MRKELILAIERIAVTWLITKGIIAEEHRIVAEQMFGGLLMHVSNELIGLFLLGVYYLLSHMLRPKETTDNAIIEKRKIFTLRPIITLLKKFLSKFFITKTKEEVTIP